jgi:AAA+ superfamily predicted ATPase
VDLAAELPLPDATARRALIGLYQGRLVLDMSASGMDSVIARTEGMSAAFLKELLRKAALLSAESEPASDDGSAIRVTDEHMATALDHLLDERSKVTRAMLGGGEADHASAHSHGDSGR